MIGAKNASVKHTCVPESARMYSSSFGASRRFNGLMTPAPRNDGVVALEELMAVQRHDREPVAGATPSPRSAPDSRATRSRC